MLSEDDFNKQGKLFPEYDPQEHLRGIRKLRTSLSALVGEHAAAVEHAKHGSGFFAEEIQAATYIDVAYSQAMVGALAPFVEGMLHHEFSFIRYLFGGHRPDPKFHPVRSSVAADEEFWNPSLYFEKDLTRNDNIQHGYVQLLKALGLKDRMPESFDKTTDALFAYRNHALHGGYEWLEQKRMSFKNRVEREKWNAWFSFATIDDRPWMVSMTEGFIDRCIDVAGGMVQTFEQIRDELFERIAPSPPVDEIFRRWFGKP